MAVCKECNLHKPDNQMQLGVCYDCFNYGASKATMPVVGNRNAVPDLILTTSINVPKREIEAILGIVATEVALGMSIFRDIANSWRDFIGGRSATSEQSLNEARVACLNKLKAEAAALGAHAVIAVDLNYSEISTSSGGILLIAASGTAVTLAPWSAI
ncbi:heavy metal-binding domain-containing protein [Shinella sp. BYT-45]|uniref:heavy metal-binding domain-containing protein n=1 Tax=Shinella sp. BYT-45 TaxID=3377377 RepID=UPI00397F85B4